MVRFSATYFSFECLLHYNLSIAFDILKIVCINMITFLDILFCYSLITNYKKNVECIIHYFML